MQKDKARKETDELLKQTEKRLAKIYAEAQNDIAKKWDAYMEDAAKKIAPFEKAYQEAKEAGDQEAIRNLGITLSREKNKITTQSDYYKDMLDYTTEQLAHTNEKALDYVNNQMPRVYGINYNGTIDQIKTDAGRIGMGVSFNLLDERTIRNLVQTDKLDLPRKQLEKYKDKAWNAKAINSQMIQGILQGETIPEMAARLQNVTNMNEAAANRNARTMTTSAENSGRMDGMKAAEEKGLVYEKQWMATNDDRTRESHAEIDGESVPLDEPFSNKLQYPGDPEGDPGEVYNCRCTMVRHLIGVRRRDGSIATIDEEEPELIFDLPETRQEREERLAREAEEKARQEAEAAKATEPEEPGSFIESLIDAEYSPNIHTYQSYEQYAEAKSKWTETHDEKTRYIDDLNWENKGLRTDSLWSGNRDDGKIPRIEATIVKLNDQYPLPNTSKEYGTKADTLIVCDYNRAWEALPDGDNDRRLTDHAAAQVFVNDNQIVMAFNRETMVSTIKEDLEEREKAIKNGGVLSSVGYSVECTTAHEYGHALGNHISNAMIYEDETAMEYWQWYKSLSKDEIREGLSDYATTNRDEFEAECFAELQMPNPRPIAVTFKEYLDEIIKKGY